MADLGGWGGRLLRASDSVPRRVGSDRYRRFAVPDAPFAQLPETIVLHRDEVAMVLFALDVVDSVALPPADATRVRDAIRLLSSKLWPELGDLLDDDEG